MSDKSIAYIRVGVVVENDKLPWVMKDCDNHEKWYYFSYLKCDPMLDSHRHYDPAGRLLPGHTERELKDTYNKFSEFIKANPMPFDVQHIGHWNYSEKTVICIPGITIKADFDAVEIPNDFIASLLNVKIPESFVQFVNEALGMKREDIKIWLVPYYG